MEQGAVICRDVVIFVFIFFLALFCSVHGGKTMDGQRFKKVVRAPLLYYYGWVPNCAKWITAITKSHRYLALAIDSASWNPAILSIYGSRLFIFFFITVCRNTTKLHYLI